MQLARKPRRRNTIVLTSLVDVLFVLLFFFMLVTTFADWRSWSISPTAHREAETAKAHRG